MADTSETAATSNAVNITDDGGVTKEIFVEGLADSPFPQTGDQVTAHYTGTLTDGTKFDSSHDRNKPLQFTLGQGQVIKAWDLAFATMKKGEKAMITAKPEYAYGAGGSPPTIPPNATLKFEVELLNFGPKPKEMWELDTSEKLKRAEELKQEGNAAIKQDAALAVTSYDDAIRHLDSAGAGTSDPMSDEQAQLYKTLKVSCHLNASMAEVKLGSYVSAEEHATKALEEDPENAKALYRRGVARRHLGTLDEARQDLLRAAKLVPADRLIRNEYETVVKKIKAAKNRERKAFGGLFGRVSMYDDKEGVVVHHGPLPVTYMDVKVGDREPKRIAFKLFADTVPKTAENFRALCNGHQLADGKTLHYKDTIFHRVIPGFMAQGGDFENGDGTGGQSIYGAKFGDENFKLKHDRPGLLSMANAGPGTNGSQFFITFRETPHLDGKHVVFGEVIEGMDTVNLLEEMGTGDGKPKEEIRVVDCGELPADYVPKAAQSVPHEEAKPDVAAEGQTADANLASA